MQKLPFKPIALVTLLSLGIVACGSSGGSSSTKSTTATNNSSSSTDTAFYATGDVRFERDGDGELVDARHKIVNASKGDQSVYKQVYETLVKQTGENAYHQSYTAYGLHNMGTSKSPDYRVVFAAKDIPNTLPDNLDASYQGKAIFTDPEQTNKFLNGTMNMTIKNNQITGAFDFAQNGKLIIDRAGINTSDITKIPSGSNFNIGGHVSGSLKGYTLYGGFYGFVAGKQHEEVVGAIYGDLEKGTKLIEAQGTFAGSKQ
ncbi:hypothetical protein QV01_04765 [Gallibacterium genomosp. 3]|uniref:Transferrin-binding protein B C-lobe/N-lobe beta barrel domain-containing protein n=1 Tax=Gallibacterium genomosp. 3 TaxID=505345 RepID=A0A1A7NU63_9PAST|nr:hypothetical protein [Gallibacterium genomosp. 3]OBW92559.1 hypothetical protein QV01_04765 [Gallibacterium genomosp. 3]